jgi:hypothetical protein
MSSLRAFRTSHVEFGAAPPGARTVVPLPTEHGLDGFPRKSWVIRGFPGAYENEKGAIERFLHEVLGGTRSVVSLE